jgi:hypothetical protein
MHDWSVDDARQADIIDAACELAAALRSRIPADLLERRREQLWQDAMAVRPLLDGLRGLLQGFPTAPFAASVRRLTTAVAEGKIPGYEVLEMLYVLLPIHWEEATAEFAEDADHGD